MLLGRLPNTLTLDAKGRLVIPSRLRLELSDRLAKRGESSAAETGGSVAAEEEGLDAIQLHLGHLQGECLYLHTAEQHLNFLEAFMEAIDSSQDNRLLSTKVHSRFVPVSLDNAGRISIPANMLQKAGIAKEVVVVCTMDRYEIWSKEAHDRLEAADDGEFETRLEEVLSRLQRPKARSKTRAGDHG